jgi:hypothetical protein
MVEVNVLDGTVIDGLLRRGDALDADIIQEGDTGRKSIACLRGRVDPRSKYCGARGQILWEDREQCMTSRL